MPEQGWKGIVKNGWHPEKDGGGLRNQVKSLVGRGEKEQRNENHTARPLSSLQDPSSFGPPPKRTAGPVTPASPAAQTSAPSLPSRTQTPVGAGQGEEEAPPPKPWRLDSTGLSTANLPPPPARRDGADGRSPPPYTPSAKPPGLPPRLPPRTNTGSPAGDSAMAPKPPPRNPATQPSAQSGYLNQGSLNRLGAAGVSVPGFGIGTSPVEPSARPASPASPVRNAQVNELQSRFSRLGTQSSGAEAAAPAQGTTWAQKQAAFKTASAFRQDPSSVSLADARAAASTANNFRQRHGDQVSAGLQTANNLNQRYGATEGIGGREGTTPNTAAIPASPSAASPGLAGAAALLGKKKPAPPPPKKKPELSSNSAGGDAPPPVPLGTRPF